MTRRPLAPCRCGHPGAGCSCYDERVAEAGWRTPGATRGWVRKRSAHPMEPGPEVVAEVERNTCRKCGAMIRVMVYRGTGYCSARCRG